MNKEEYKGLNNIVMKLLEDQKRNTKILGFLLVVSIFANIVISGIFVYYESKMTTETTTETEICQEVEGDSAEINNVKGEMYKDNAVHNTTEQQK